MKKSTLLKAAMVLLAVALIPATVFAGGQAESQPGSTDSLIETQAKYVFLFIGDGMSMTQITAAEAYLSAKNGTSAGVKALTMSQFPAQGLTTTYSSNAFITDSAAAGTAIACGQKTESGVISMDPSKTKKFETIAEMAKAAGMKVGILSSVNLDHATPATFYAHNASRKNYYDINMEMANSNFDFFAGGMVRVDKTPEGQKSAHDVMEERGFQLASTRTELEALKPGTPAYAYNVGFAGNALDYAIDQDTDDITIAEFTKKGIELLDNENGFFMMIEGGKIDWACHANDAAASISNTLAFDAAIEEAVAFYNKHPEETVIIVTGDHETGGLTLGFAGTKYGSAFNMIDEQAMSFEAFDAYVLKPYKESAGTNAQLSDLMPEIKKAFGMTEFDDLEMKKLEAAFAQYMGDKTGTTGYGAEVSDAETYLLYGGYNPISVTLTHILNNRAGIGWTSYSHTGVPVPTFAMGVAQESFNGYYDNTDIFKKMAEIMGLNAKVAVAQ